MKGAALGGGTIAGGATVSALAYAGAPWWAIALVASVLTAVGAVVGLATIFIPQDSQDRLEWWRDRRNHRARKHSPSRRRTLPAGKS